MVAVTVEFQVQDAKVEEFNRAMAEQARNSLEKEDDCHRFDICHDDEVIGRVFLYEIYTDRNAFELHLASEHFKQFDAEVKGWIVSKKVDVWNVV